MRATSSRRLRARLMDARRRAASSYGVRAAAMPDASVVTASGVAAATFASVARSAARWGRASAQRDGRPRISSSVMLSGNGTSAGRTKGAGSSASIAAAWDAVSGAASLFGVMMDRMPSPKRSSVTSSPGGTEISTALRASESSSLISTSMPRSGARTRSFSTENNAEYRQKSRRLICSPVSAWASASIRWLLPDSFPPTIAVMMGSSGTLMNGYHWSPIISHSLGFAS